MTARHAHGSARASAVVVPLIPLAGTDSTTEATGAESFITELTSAVRHLEKALELGGTPARFLLPNGATVTAAQPRLWVAQHTARVQNLLDQITGPYTDPQT
ncbi:hypothetical protein ACIPSA_49880 [Streptomyces sp. NPDC086549]|uniref:hypothetical protein n=1 Tax=Streptomyces sp. NPDC086549 TaxID=3365752 RepID=UPI0038206591